MLCSCLSVTIVINAPRWRAHRTPQQTKKPKQTKEKHVMAACFVKCKHRTCRYPPGLRRNARRWPRPPGSRNPDDFPPCSQLQHGLSTPGLQPADKPADRTALRGTETLMDHKGCSWTHRRSANRYHLWLTAGRPGVDWRQRERTRDAAEGRRPRSRGVTTRGETSPHRVPNPPYTYLVKDCESSLSLIIILIRRGEKKKICISLFFPYKLN